MAAAGGEGGGDGGGGQSCGEGGCRVLREGKGEPSAQIVTQLEPSAGAVSWSRCRENRAPQCSCRAGSTAQRRGGRSEMAIAAVGSRFDRAP
eukprot:scaffold52626_cov61-Phaeocystis_antarctica.AAC.1